MKMAIFCTRCGEELTAPKFHNGKPYGYSCYAVITGKKSQDKRQFVEVDLLAPLPELNYFPLVVRYQGKRYNLGGTFRDVAGKPHNSLAEFGADGQVYMVTHDRKGKCIWESLPRGEIR